jgi:hypothetical protein
VRKGEVAFQSLDMLRITSGSKAWPARYGRIGMSTLQRRVYICEYTVSGRQAQAHRSPRALELPEWFTLCRVSDTLPEPEPSRAQNIGRPSPGCTTSPTLPRACVFGSTSQPVSHWIAGATPPVALAYALLRQICAARGAFGLRVLLDCPPQPTTERG